METHVPASWPIAIDALGTPRVQGVDEYIAKIVGSQIQACFCAERSILFVGFNYCTDATTKPDDRAFRSREPQHSLG